MGGDNVQRSAGREKCPPLSAGRRRREDAVAAVLIK